MSFIYFVVLLLVMLKGFGYLNVAWWVIWTILGLPVALAILVALVKED